jgi:hypothetical protein
MELYGIDIYIWNSDVPELPKQSGKFSLALIANHGTRIYPPPTPDIALSNWHQCRFLSDSPVTHQEVGELIHHLSSQGHVWTKCQKLFKSGDTNLFSEPY